MEGDGGSGACAGAGSGVGAAAEQQGEHEAPPEAPPAHKRARATVGGLVYDPVAFECPIGGCEYDCLHRVPVRSACDCKRLLCCKCAAVATSIPTPTSCDLCGASGVGPFEAQSYLRDVGVLLSLMARLPPSEPQLCVDCDSYGERTGAEYCCSEAKCAGKPLCGVHVMAHRLWGHTVTVLVLGKDATPSSSSLLGVTHCSRPEHAGVEGVLSLRCRPCGSLLCRACGDEHLREGHVVVPMDIAATEGGVAIVDALPKLHQGAAFYMDQASRSRELLESLSASRAGAIEALQAATTRLHAEVDASHATKLADIEVAYNAKVVAVERAAAVARAGAAELVTIAAAAEATLAPGATALMRVHVERSVAASMPLALSRVGVSVDVGLGGEGAPSDSSVPPQALSLPLPSDGPGSLPSNKVLSMYRGALSSLDSILSRREEESGEAVMARCCAAESAVDWVLYTLATVGTDAKCAESAVGILLSVSYGIPGEESGTLMRAVGPVLAAMRTHMDVANVAEFGVGFLENLADNALNVDQLRNMGVVEATRAAMARHPTEACIQEWGSGMLTALGSAAMT